MTVRRLAAVGGTGPRGAGGRAGGVGPCPVQAGPWRPHPSGRSGPTRYWMWQAVEDVAWQHMQVGFTDLGGMRSRSSSSGISSNR